MIPSYLYHYTSVKALLDILRTNTIRFTRLDRLKDPLEGFSEVFSSEKKFVFSSSWFAQSTEALPMWKMYNNFGTGIIGKYFWTSVLIGFMVLGGLILLIVPGVIISLMYQFALFILVEKKLKTNEALHRSNQLTNGIKWQLFGFSLLVGFLAILIQLPISLLQNLNLNFLYLPLNTIVSPIVAMFITMAGIFIYKDISAQEEDLDNLIKESSEQNPLSEDENTK